MAGAAIRQLGQDEGMAKLRPEAEACDGRRVGGPRLVHSRMAQVEGMAKPRPEAEEACGRAEARGRGV